MNCTKCGQPLPEGAKFCQKCGAPAQTRQSFCRKCGQPLPEGVKFCQKCGTSVAAPVKEAPKAAPAKETPKKEPEKKPEKKTPKVKSTEPEKAPSNFREALLDLLRHPKKLLPTIILAVVWLVLSLLSGFGVNVPILRFFYTLTYANGGMLGGLPGLVGGIFGKAVFAAVVNAIVLSLCQKKNPFSGVGGGLKTALGAGAFSGLSAVSPLLIGAGAGLVLYWFFNMTSSPVNCSVAVVAAVGALQAAGKQNGLLTSLLFRAAGKLSKGKTPSQTTVSRGLTGLAAGFAAGLPLTFVRFGWLLFVCGAAVLACGIAFAIVGKKGGRKLAAAAMLAVLLASAILPMTLPAQAADAPKGYVPMGEVFRIEDGDGSQPYQYGKIDGFYLVLDHMTSTSQVLDGLSATYGAETKYDAAYDTVQQTISGKPSVSFTRSRNSDAVSVSGTFDWKRVYPGEPGSAHKAGESVATSSQLELTISDISFEGYRVYGDITGHLDASQTENGMPKASSSVDFNCKHVEGGIRFDSDNDVVYLAFFAADESSPHGRTNATLVFRIDSVLPKGKKEGKAASAASSKEESADPDYVPYRGRLTYTNGAMNKHGQPFPDLMDFNEDGVIDWLDENTRRELSHNPDYLDLPLSGKAITAAALLSALFGGAGAAAAGAAASVASTAASAAAEAAGAAASAVQPSLPDLGRYISRDNDGDLNVTDPATGERRVYVANGDGTYTNPLTGATYTEAELKDSLESRAENAGLIRQDEAVRDAAVTEQAADNKKVSFYDAEAKAEREAAEKAAAHEEYKAKMYFKHGVEEGDDKGVKKDILQKTGEEYERQAKYEARAEYADAGYETAKQTKQAADVAIDVLAEVDKTGVGKVIKDGYAVASSAAGNMGEVMAGEKSVGAALTQTVVDSAAELAKNHTDSAAGKYAANIFGDSAKEMSKAALKGGSLEDIRQAGEKGAIGGAVNATVDVAFDGAGDLVSSAMKDGGKAVGKAFGQEITKKTAADAAKTLADDVVKNALGGDDD